MPHTKQHLQRNVSRRRAQRSRVSDIGICLTEEESNPRCLKRLYQNVRSGIEDNIALLAEQAMERLLEQEQLKIGWDA